MNKQIVTTPIEFIYTLILTGMLATGVMLWTGTMQFTKAPETSTGAGSWMVLVGLAMGVFRSAVTYMKMKKEVKK